MAFDLEVLVGHLYVVGGRTISTTPPGALVEVAPKKAARGREPDTFFVMVLPSGDVHAPTTFYQQMSHMAAERYFNNSGSVTSALRSVLNTLNHNLFEHNESGRSHYEAHVICAVLRGRDLIVVRVGAAVAVLRHDGQTQTFPEDLTNDEDLFKPPLGVQPMPELKMTRFDVRSGTRLVLGDDNLAEVAAEHLTDSLVLQDLEQVLDELKKHILERVSVMAVEFVPPDEPVALPVAIGESSSAITAEVAAARTRVQQAEQQASVSVERKRRNPFAAVGKLIRRFVAFIAQFLAGFLSVLSALLDTVFPPPEDGSDRKFLTPVTSTAVIGIPLVIVVLVVLAWAGGIDETRFEQCLDNANAAVDVANSIDTRDPASVVAAWQGVLEIAESCEDMRPTDANIVSIKREAQTVIDTLNNTERREAMPIISLPNASLSRLVLQGLDIYALDGENDLVYRVRLTPDGQSAASSDIIASMRRGTTVDGLPIGDFIDITFDDSETAITALDSSGVLVRCPPQFIGECDAQRVLASENWRNPIAMTIWRGKLYVLDQGSSQIWRYEPAGGSYASQPTEYFTITPNLNSVVDFDIDNNGHIFLLSSDGVMRKYLSGEAQTFQFSNFLRGQELNNERTAQSMYLNDDQIDQGFLIVSRPARAIYQTTLSGTFQNTYRVFDDDNLALVSDVTYDPTTSMIYVASGNTIFGIYKAE